MSNVLKRNRSTSKVEYLAKSREVREYITGMILNENIVPKRYRFIFSVPMVDSCRNLTRAADRYYNSACEIDINYDANQFTELYNRKMCALRDMLDACSDILDYFQSIKLHTFIKVEFREKVVGRVVEIQEIVQEYMGIENDKYTNYFFSKDN